MLINSKSPLIKSCKLHVIISGWMSQWFSSLRGTAISLWVICCLRGNNIFGITWILKLQHFLCARLHMVVSQERPCLPCPFSRSLSKAVQWNSLGLRNTDYPGFLQDLTHGRLCVNSYPWYIKGKCILAEGIKGQWSQERQAWEFCI